jgi:hypothetical protein
MQEGERERRPSLDDPQLQVKVAEYSRSRAEQVVRDGLQFSDQPDWSDERVIDELVTTFVEVTVGLDYDVVGEDSAMQAVRRIRVPIEAALE